MPVSWSFLRLIPPVFSLVKLSETELCQTQTPLKTWSIKGIFRASLPTHLCVYGLLSPIEKSLLSLISRHNHVTFEGQTGLAGRSSQSSFFHAPAVIISHLILLAVTRRHPWLGVGLSSTSWDAKVIRSAWATHGAHPCCEGQLVSSVCSGWRTQNFIAHPCWWEGEDATCRQVRDPQWASLLFTQLQKPLELAKGIHRVNTNHVQQGCCSLVGRP